MIKGGYIMSNVIIGIATYKRPEGLKNLIYSILLQKVNFGFSILVIDNDVKDRQGIQLVEDIKNRCRIPIFAVIEKKRGISEARNRMIDIAFNEKNTNMLIMVDDDMIVEANWLEKLVNAYQQFKADIIGGHVAAKFIKDRPDWTINLQIYDRKIKEKGMVKMINGTGNILISRDLLRKLGKPYFDTAFSSTGGGDKEFFVRAKKAGVTMAYTPDAIAYEVISESRANKKWVIKRAYRIGISDIRILKKYQYYTKLITEMGKAAIVITFYPLFYLVFTNNEIKQLKVLICMSRAVGKIAALFNFKYHEYKHTHGI